MRAAVAHGGGPTAVLNSSLAGVVAGCRGRFSSLLAAPFGLPGFLDGDLRDLLAVPESRWAEIARAPGSVIGSSRRKLSDAELDEIAERLRGQGIDVLLLTGGNGTMGTALDLTSRGVRVVGVPKTIDNDLLETHHTPGYASTAYFFACAARDIEADNRALPSPICILETLGRNAGWIVAATALARQDQDDAPHLIYVPERRLGLGRIAADVEAVYGRLGRCVVAVCEGQLDESGRSFGADVDRPGDPAHSLASNLGHTLAQLVSAKLGLRARAERPGLLGRSCGPYARERDLREAFACGYEAVLRGADGGSGVMATLDAEGQVGFAVLDAVARRERLLPAEFISTTGNDVTAAFLEYARPLVGPVPAYARL